jgi:AraC-like DNA-binding protein
MPNLRGNNGHDAPTGDGGRTSRVPAAPNPAHTPNGRGRPPRAGSSFAARFGRVILQDGIATIPSALLHHQGELQLSAQQVWFVSYILAHKWDEDLPYPSLKAMAKRVGMSLSQLQRIKNSLCHMGFLQVYPRFTGNQGQATNAYDFAGLFDRLEDAIAATGPAANPVREDDERPPDMAELGEVDPSFVARYGRVITRRGVAAVPRAMFTHQAELEMTPQQVWFVTYIFSFQWDTALPYPSLRKMAAQTGYSSVQLHTIKGELVSRGYLRLVHRSNREGGQDTNAYDFSGLLDSIRALLQPNGPKHDPPTAPEPQPADSSRMLPRRRGRRALPAKEGDSVELSRRDRIHLTGRDSIGLTRGDSAQFSAPGSARLNGGDSIQLTGPDVAGLAAPGGAELSGEDGAQLPPPAKPTRARGTSAAYRAGVARGLHEEESVHVEQEKKNRVDSNHIARGENSGANNRTPGATQNGTTKQVIPAATVTKNTGNNAEVTPPPYSPYVASVIADFSTELGDSAHVFANVTQALRLWQVSGLDEQGFVGLMYEAKRLTRSYQGKQGLGGIANKMAYFFRVARNLAEREQGEG